MFCVGCKKYSDIRTSQFSALSSPPASLLHREKSAQPSSRPHSSGVVPQSSLLNCWNPRFRVATGQLYAGGIGRLLMCGLEYPHTCIQGLLYWGMESEGEWASVQGPPLPVPPCSSRELQNPEHCKFQPGLPHRYEVISVKVGGHNIFYLTVC